MYGTNGINPNNTNNNADADLRLIVQNLVAEIKEKQDLVGEKNAEIRGLLTRLERVNQRLGEKDNTIDELKEKLDKNVSEPIKNSDTLPEGVIFPFEVFDAIFRHSSASTRVNLAATNSSFHQRYHQWKDVTSVFITRHSIKLLPKVTIIPHTYLIRTNIPSVSSFSSTNLISMAPTLFYVKQMLIESNKNQRLSAYNNIRVQSGFFSHFKNLENVKIVNVSENLSLRFNLNELFALPNLRILHICENKLELKLPESNLISAPIEQLRMLISDSNPEKFEEFIDALSPTLTSLDFSTLKTLTIQVGGATLQAGGEIIPAVTSKCAKLIELHIPSIVSRHPSFNSTVPLLKRLTKLKRISFEILHLSNLVNIVENLSSSCESIIITDNFHINDKMIALKNATAAKYDKFLNGKNYELLQFECNRIHRNFTIQFGRLRESNPLTNAVTETVQIILNVSPEPKCKPRIYISAGTVLTREEYLTHMGIVLHEDSAYKIY